MSDSGEGRTRYDRNACAIGVFGKIRSAPMSWQPQPQMMPIRISGKADAAEDRRRQLLAFRILDADGFCDLIQGCAYRKSHPDILVMQPTKHGPADNMSRGVDRA